MTAATTSRRTQNSLRKHQQLCPGPLIIVGGHCGQAPGEKLGPSRSSTMRHVPESRGLPGLDRLKRRQRLTSWKSRRSGLPTRCSSTGLRPAGWMHPKACSHASATNRAPGAMPGLKPSSRHIPSQMAG